VLYHRPQEAFVFSSSIKSIKKLESSFWKCSTNGGPYCYEVSPLNRVSYFCVHNECNFLLLLGLLLIKESYFGPRGMMSVRRRRFLSSSWSPFSHIKKKIIDSLFRFPPNGNQDPSHVFDNESVDPRSIDGSIRSSTTPCSAKWSQRFPSSATDEISLEPILVRWTLKDCRRLQTLDFVLCSLEWVDDRQRQQQ
jgi:hypothetical protein